MQMSLKNKQNNLDDKDKSAKIKMLEIKLKD